MVDYHDLGIHSYIRAVFAHPLHKFAARPLLAFSKPDRLIRKSHLFDVLNPDHYLVSSIQHVHVNHRTRDNVTFTPTDDLLLISGMMLSVTCFPKTNMP